MSAAEEEDALSAGSGPAREGSGGAAGGPAPRRKARKTIVGEVVSDKMDKTISVQVTRLERHRRYQKYVRRHTTYKAHDEKREARVGDIVRIAQSRPLSKTKNWRLVEVLRRPERVDLSVISGPESVEAAEGVVT